ncbi:hypothetical protein ACLBV0_16175, partial [Pseudomonas aeruginosa]
QPSWSSPCTAAKAWLERHRQPYRAIAGDWAERRRQAFAAVQGLLQDG